jgi:hypothetical protein
MGLPIMARSRGVPFSDFMLARIPFGWLHPNDKNSRQINNV